MDPNYPYHSSGIKSFDIPLLQNFEHLGTTICTIFQEREVFRYFAVILVVYFKNVVANTMHKNAGSSSYRKLHKPENCFGQDKIHRTQIVNLRSP